MVAHVRRFVRRALGLSRFGFSTPCGIVSGSHVPCLCDVCHDRLAEVVFDELDDNDVLADMLDAGVVVLYQNKLGDLWSEQSPAITRAMRRAS